MPKITETIHSLMETIGLIEMLEDIEFRESNWITEEDIPLLRGELIEKIEDYKAEAYSYIEWKLKEMNTAKRHSEGISKEIERLSELKTSYEKTYNKGKNRIDYLMKTFQIEKLDTEFNKLSFRSSSSVEIVDETALPEEYFRIVPETKSPDKIVIKQAFKEGKEVPWATIVEKQNLQIK